MMGTHFRVILGLFNLFVVKSQYVQSPCPGVFDYQSDGFSVYGVIRLQHNEPAAFVTTRAYFTVATRLPSTYEGHLEPIGSDLFLPDSNQGSPIIYRVHFPVTSPLPRLMSITANGNAVCYGTEDNSEQNQFVSAINLQHTLFQKPETPSSGGFNQSPGFNQAPFNPSYQQQQPSFQQPQNRPPRPNRPLVQPNQPTISLPNYNQKHPEQSIEAVPLSAQTTPPPTQQPPRTQLPVDEGCGVVSGGNESVPLILNGKSYVRGDWPWLVAIYKRKKGSLSFICGGTLISNKHIVTAAHCIQLRTFATPLKDIVVKLGVYDLNDWADDTSITRAPVSAFVHDSYNATSFENDIIVLSLGRPVEFNTYIRPACLWNGKTDQSRIIGALGIMVGWGNKVADESGQGEPRIVRIPVVSTSTCRASNDLFRSLTSANTLCAGGDRIGLGMGPCIGDSGTGLLLVEDGRWRLRGVVSLSLRPPSGELTCNLNEYVVFTDVAQYITWIQGVMTTNVLT